MENKFIGKINLYKDKSIREEYVLLLDDDACLLFTPISLHENTNES